jgi:hypothetical protein
MQQLLQIVWLQESHRIQLRSDVSCIMTTPIPPTFPDETSIAPTNSFWHFGQVSEAFLAAWLFILFSP